MVPWKPKQEKKDEKGIIRGSIRRKGREVAAIIVQEMKLLTPVAITRKKQA